MGPSSDGVSPLVDSEWSHSGLIVELVVFHTSSSWSRGPQVTSRNVALQDQFDFEFSVKIASNNTIS